MTRMDQIASALVGTWIGSDDGKLYILKLKEDRSLTGSIDSEQISGTWHVQPMEINNGYRSIIMNLNLGSQVHPCNINLGNTVEPLEEYLEKLIFSGWHLPTFRKGNDAD